MVFEPPEVAPPPPQAPSCGIKVRLRFRKGGDLRLVSHHDLMHCFERMIRRAVLPVRATQGFHPKPRVIFAQSLALGILGCEEVVELELEEPLSAAEVHERLARQAPPGLEMRSARVVSRQAKAQVRRAGYRVPLPAQRVLDLPARIRALLASPHAWVDRTRPQPRRLDVRPYLSELDVHENVLEMMLWVTPVGAARPEEILQLLGLADVLDEGAVIERTILELHDEANAEPTGLLPGGPAVPPSHEKKEQADNDHGLATQPARADKTPRPSSLIPGPMSFDS
jgi:radical SAM-linked protein